MKIVTIFSFLLLWGCGASPLFNHKSELKSVVNDSTQVTSDHFHFPKTGRAFTVEWAEGPRLGESRFVMKTWLHGEGTINGPYQDIQSSLNIFLWMPAMGHGSSPVKITRLDQGEYEVSEVQFIMGGKWEIKFQLKEGTQVIDEYSVPVTL